MSLHALRLSLILLLAACGATAGPRRGNSDVLSREEILASTASTAYELIAQLRPQFLRSRGALSMQDPRPVYPIVYVNEMRHGGLETLRAILVREISEVRFISAADATTRWGTGHAGGVIQVRAFF